MNTRSEALEIAVDDEQIDATLLAPSAKMPGVLFVHGWGGSQKRDIARAKGLAGLGCVCLTFDMRGHERTLERQQRVTREDNLRDLLSAYDRLARHPSIDPSAIAVVGSSYGGYLSTILTSLRPVRWLALRVPALYRDEGWLTPKRELDRKDLVEYRNTPLPPTANRALAACAAFEGDVLIVESEQDHLIPHTTITNYLSAFARAHSLTHRIIDGADHGLTNEACRQAYTSLLINWATEMVVGARVGDGVFEEVAV
ncbi:alpha/beta hydrolase family protein [Pseudomonas indica]|uniref:alpha/beta hydrolase family protein n=1 Tax=Pseudomonas indica TaxID=137658 RepID=UPI0023F85182|nr:alpha/beta fold hydrolase [Pseudomonas indica]MBU3056640.1 alpha/beta fold hydrolase [Pseudomonas indica]